MILRALQSIAYMHMQFEILRSIEKFIFTYIYRSCIARFLMCIRWTENKFVKKRFFVKKWIFFYVTPWRICSKGHSRFQKKKKKKSDFGFFHCSYPILNIANFEFRVWYLDHYETFSITFSNFFEIFDFHSFYSTCKSYNISNEEGGKNDSNTLIFELQCDHVKVLKCVNYLKHERFIEARKVCRGLTHFVSKCSVAVTQSIKCFIYFQQYKMKMLNVKFLKFD